MDGLTITTNQGLLETGRTVSQLEKAKLQGDAGIKPASESKNFADTLKDAVNQVDSLQKNADVLMQKLATGESKNIPEVMIAAEKADVALKLMVQVRNKMIEAYQEVMKMQV